MRKNREVLLYISLLLFIVFFFLTFLVSDGVLRHFDYQMTVLLQKLIPNQFILPLSVFSILGAAEIAGTILLIILFAQKKLNKILFLILFVLTGVFEYAGKIFIHQIGPPHHFLKTYKFISVPTDYLPGSFFAYPSGHFARTAFVSAVLLFVILKSKRLNMNKKMILILVIGFFDFLMFISRIYLGEHWFSDVLGGLILGFALFFLGAYFSRRFSAR